MRLPLGLKHYHILLPKGFIQGQKLQETLRQLTLPFSNSTNFDQLPTPFRAVATDLETGDAVLLDKGDLSIAMRASISAPGVFAPVEYQGRLLVDGGIAENLPIDVARAMHADILIVSDVSFPLQPRDRLDSALSISNQMLAIMVRKNADRQKATLGPRRTFSSSPRSAPRPPPISPLAASTIAAGRSWPRVRSSRGLRRSRVSDAAYQAYMARRATQQPGLPVIKFVRVDPESQALREDHSRRDGAAGRQAARSRRRGRAHHRSLRAGLFRDAGLHAWSRKGEGPTRSTGSRCGRGANPGDRITCVSAWTSSRTSRATINTTSPPSFYMTEIDDLAAELQTNVQIGSDTKITSEFYQPLDALAKWFVAPRVRIESRDLPIYHE